MHHGSRGCPSQRSPLPKKGAPTRAPMGAACPPGPNWWHRRGSPPGRWSSPGFGLHGAVPGSMPGDRHREAGDGLLRGRSALLLVALERRRGAVQRERARAYPQNQPALALPGSAGVRRGSAFQKRR